MRELSIFYYSLCLLFILSFVPYLADKGAMVCIALYKHLVDGGVDLLAMLCVLRSVCNSGYYVYKLAQVGVRLIIGCWL